MSFHLNLSSDEEEEQGLEDLWKKAHEDQNKYEDDDDDDDNENGIFSFNGGTTGVAKLPSSVFNDFTEDDDADSVDWEDAEDGGNDGDQEDGEDENSKRSTDIAIPKKQHLKPVTVDLDSKPASKTEKSNKRQKKARKRYSHASLPNHVQFLLDNLHKAHLLAMTSHALFNSNQCSDELLLPVAHSLLPAIWINTEQQPNEKEGFCTPTVSQLREFCDWLFDLVHNAEQRRQQTLRANIAAGAPRPVRRVTRRKRSPMSSEDGSSTSSLSVPKVSSTKRLLEYCSYLAMTQSENPQVLDQNLSTDWSPVDKVNLLIALARSLGWRARYAVAVEPAKRDLDMDHPIFMSATVNVFQAISTWSRPNSKKSKPKQEVIDIEEDEKPKKKRACQQNKKPGEVKNDDMPNNSEDNIFAPEGDGMLVGWVEILCRDDNDKYCNKMRQSKAVANSGNNKPKMRWVHVDPQLRVIDDPGRVEPYLFEIKQQRERNQSHGQGGFEKRSSGGSSRKKHPVAYVVAVEHYGASDSSQQKRITDVTPRYASSMVESMKLRGITPRQQAAILSKTGATWWSKTIKTLNASFKGLTTSSPRRAARRDSPKMASRLSGKNNEEAIDIISDNDEAAKEDNEEEEDREEEEDAVESLEKQELAKSVKNEALPTSKEKFKNHPLYVIPSVLKKTEVLAPDAKKRMCGIFKGEIVYPRSDVSEALAEKKWLYQGRKVRETELKKPIKRVKGRAKSSNGGGASFKALKSYGVGKENDGSAQSEQKQLEDASKPLDDGMQDLYAIWQTEPWGPSYVSPTDPIPLNEYKNVELELLNPGLTHIPEQGVAAVAKQLGIPYAPCLLGFEGHNGNRTPTIRGIVVHDHNAELLREASVEVVSRSVEEEHEKRRKDIYTKWKKLIVGVLTKDRLEREYGE